MKKGGKKDLVRKLGKDLKKQRNKIAKKLDKYEKYSNEYNLLIIDLAKIERKIDTFKENKQAAQIAVSKRHIESNKNNNKTHKISGINSIKLREISGGGCSGK